MHNYYPPSGSTRLSFNLVASYMLFLLPEMHFPFLPNGMNLTDP